TVGPLALRSVFGPGCLRLARTFLRRRLRRRLRPGRRFFRRLVGGGFAPAATRRLAVLVQDFAALLFRERGGVFAFGYAGVEVAIGNERAIAAMLDLDAAVLEVADQLLRFRCLFL